MTIQEENWEIMSVLGMPWKDILALTEDDKKFLLAKVVEIKEQYVKEQEMAVREQQEQARLMAQEAAQGGDVGPAGQPGQPGQPGDQQADSGLRASDGRELQPW